MDREQERNIEALYLQMYDRLLIYARCSLESKPLAEEAVQETFYVACQRPEALCASKNPQGWLMRTLKNTIRNMKRRQETARRVLEVYLTMYAGNSTFTEDRFDVSILYDDLADTEEFKLLVDMAVRCKSYKEMAKARGITVSTCKKRVQRAKELLQRKISPDVTK